MIRFGSTHSHRQAARLASSSPRVMPTVSLIPLDFDLGDGNGRAAGRLDLSVYACVPTYCLPRPNTTTARRIPLVGARGVLASCSPDVVVGE